MRCRGQTPKRPRAEDQAEVNQASRPTLEPMAEPGTRPDARRAARPDALRAQAPAAAAQFKADAEHHAEADDYGARAQAEAQREAEPSVDASGGKAASRPAIRDSRRA
jgi:hypothetical protein